MLDTTLLKIVTSIFEAIGLLSVIFGAVVLAYGFAGSEGLERGWNSRKKQGLIMMFSGAILYSLNVAAASVSTHLDSAYACETLPFIGKYAPALGLVVIFVGVAEIALHALSDKMGDRIIGIRLLAAGAMIVPIGKLVDFLNHHFTSAALPINSIIAYIQNLI